VRATEFPSNITFLADCYVGKPGRLSAGSNEISSQRLHKLFRISDFPVSRLGFDF